LNDLGKISLKKNTHCTGLTLSYMVFNPHYAAAWLTIDIY